MAFIDGKEVKESDRGRNVVYVPHHVNNNIQHPDCKVGIISSFDDTNVWVKFLAPNGEKCNTADLRWY